jgi:hypothetical protein
MAGTRIVFRSLTEGEFCCRSPYRWSHRTSLSALLRSGSNYPLIGHHENRDGVWTVGSRRNTERLPYYACLNVRADRSSDFANMGVPSSLQGVNIG